MSCKVKDTARTLDIITALSRYRTAREQNCGGLITRAFQRKCPSWDSGLIFFVQWQIAIPQHACATFWLLRADYLLTFCPTHVQHACATFRFWWAHYVLTSLLPAMPAGMKGSREDLHSCVFWACFCMVEVVIDGVHVSLYCSAPGVLWSASLVLALWCPSWQVWLYGWCYQPLSWARAVSTVFSRWWYPCCLADNDQVVRLRWWSARIFSWFFASSLGGNQRKSVYKYMALWQKKRSFSGEK